MSDATLHRVIEAASLRAWPALEEIDLDGWTLRHSLGFSGRANSVQSLEGVGRGIDDGLSLDERVAECERWYGERGRPSLFRMTPFSRPGLDEYLAGRGYERFNPTHVLTRDVPGLAAATAAVELREAALHEWLGRYATFTGIPATPAPMRRIIEKSTGRPMPGLVWAGPPRRVVACGLAVLEGELLGLFDLVVDPPERRKGYGEGLVRRLAEWGSGEGARRVYLQVTADNTPALALYAKLGFERAYDYWYRIRRT